MLPLLLALQVTSHDAVRYDITLIPSDTGTHLLGEVETAWRLRSAEAVGVVLDSSMRVVRVLIDGKPNTRLSRTMYGRSDHDLLVPHQKRSGDSITTRVRYHGLARGSAFVGSNRSGARVFVATGQQGGDRFWLPVPEQPALDRAAAGFRIQAPLSERVIASGSLVGIDTLPYGDATWRYRMDDPAPISSLAVAAGPYQVSRVTPGRCGDGCPQVELWSYETGADPKVLERTWRMVEFFAARAGRFPYARLVYAEAPVAAVTAAPGLVLYPEGGFSGPDSSIALETARQWFGVAVSPADSTAAPLIGGLARYLAALWPDSAGRKPAEQRAGAASGDLHRLRGAVGDSAFFAGLSRFVRDRLHQPAGRSDFVAAMSAAAGRDLERVVPGAPSGTR